MREVTVHYGLAIGGSSIKVGYRHPLAGCVRLDACGLRGSDRLSLAGAKPATLELSAIGPAGRPRLDFLTALGIASGGDPHGITVDGYGELRPGGTIAALTRQPATHCSDRAPLGGAELSLRIGRKPTVALELGAGLAGDYVRTSCPGPELGFRTLASATFAATELQGRTPRFRLVAPRTFTVGGYQVQLTPHVTLTATRGRISDIRVRYEDLGRPAVRRGLSSARLDVGPAAG